jgi:hypothetical protein
MTTPRSRTSDGRLITPPPVSEEYIASCSKRAEALRERHMETITPHSVAWLLGGHMTSPTDRERIICRILLQTGSHDGVWHYLEVMEAYRLRKLSHNELYALDPDPPKAKPLPEQFRSLSGFSELLAQRTQSASTRR